MPAPTEVQKAVQAQQLLAWGFYGYPVPHNRRDERLNPTAVGEVRYVVGWAADQMSRMRWKVIIDGKEEWSVQLPDNPDGTKGEIITSKPSEVDAEDEDSLASASA